MMKKKFLTFPFLVLFVVSVLNVDTTLVSAVKYPVIYVDPATTLDTTIMPGENYTISIRTDYEGTDIYSYRFTLTFNPSVLQGMKVTNGDLITETKKPSARVDFFPGDFDNNAGNLSVTLCVFFFTAPDPAPLTYGPGTLANVTFQIVGKGTSNITLGPITRLAGWTEDGYGDYYPIIDAETMPNHIRYGFFSNLYAVYVDPATTLDTTIMPGENYTISIKTNYNGTDIWGWEFTLTFNPNVLKGISVTNGDLITQAKNESAQFAPGTFNNTLGKLSLTGAGFQYAGTPLPVTSGPGTLANVTFEVISKGTSDITLGSETRLIGYNATADEAYNIIDATTMPDQIYHGYFDNTLHDIAVTNVTAPPEPVKIGEQASINVTVTNEGDHNETVTVTVYADMNTTVIGDEITLETPTNVNLTAGNSTTLTFNWNTTGVRSGIYTITASASVVLGEKNTTNNVGWTTVAIGGPPVASFTYSPEGPVVDETVTFNASASYDPDTNGTIVSYKWNFGDGNITSVDYPAITHVYTTAGNYTVNLNVTDIENETDTTTKPIVIRKLSSNITISTSRATFTLGENTTISGYITPTRVNAAVTIWYKLSDEITWNTANVTTNEESLYSYTWTPATAGTYELEASWLGDSKASPAESSTITVEVTKIHDIAVTSVTLSSDTVKMGEMVFINVTVTNQGHYTETFNVTVYANTTLIDTLIDVFLGSGSSTFTITWGITEIAKGDYTIKANASTVKGEIDTDDNTYINGVVSVQETPAVDILLYAVVATIAIIVILAIVIYTLKFRRTKPI